MSKNISYEPLYVCSQCLKPVRRVRYNNRWRWTHVQPWRNYLHQPATVIEKKEVEKMF